MFMKNQDKIAQIVDTLAKKVDPKRSSFLAHMQEMNPGKTAKLTCLLLKSLIYLDLNELVQFANISEE